MHELMNNIKKKIPGLEYKIQSSPPVIHKNNSALEDYSTK